MPFSTLFFPTTLALSDVALLVSGLFDATAFDRIDFSDEQGGDADRQLAIPYLADMDEVVTDDAHVSVRAVSRPMDISAYTLSRPGGDNEGILLKLNDVSRLLEVEFTGSPLPLLSEAPSLRFVVRPFTSSGFGPPIFAQPSFSAPGNGRMFGRVLAGLSYFGSASDRFVIGFPSLSGNQWLFQLATGDDPTSLTPISFGQNLTRVRVDAAPKNLTVVLNATPPVTLWSHPGLLLPDAGEQVISFTPLAQQHLAKALAASEVTLAVPLRFHSDSGGALALTSKVLTAHYLEHPLSADPLKVRLLGTWAEVALLAPAAKLPFDSSFDFSAKALGRELNAGSPVPDPVPPHDGIRISGGLCLSTSVPFLAREGDTAGGPLNLASVNLYLSAVQDAEIVVEIRPDVSGIPGPPATDPIVQQLKRGFADWSEFVLTRPLPVVTGGAPVWVSLRANQGEVFWFGGGSGTVRSSADRGQTWAPVEDALATVNPPLVQLFHQLPDGTQVPPPIIQTQVAGVDAGTIELSAAAGGSDFASSGYRLSSSVLSRLQAAPESGRVETDLLLFSRSALDLTIKSGTLSYE